MATPLVPEDYLDLFDPLRAGAELRGRVVAVRRETADAVTIEIEPSRSWPGHLPGQYLRLGVDVNGVRHWRSYSLTSAPGSATVTITPKRVAGGLVSSYVVDQLKVGDLVHLEAPDGTFRLPSELPAKVLFVTAGSGITPVLGLLRSHLTALTDVVLVHSDPDAAAVIAGAELRAYAEAGSLTLIERHTGREGRLTPADLTTLVPDWRERETWACGPAALLDALEDHWEQQGAADKLHVERFQAALRAEVGEGGRVDFTVSDRTVDVDGSTALLDAGEAAGVVMPSGCRMGICFSCVVPMTSGSVRDLRTGHVTTADESAVHVQTCVSAVAGACRIEL